MSEATIDMLKFTEMKTKQFNEETITVNFFGINTLLPEMVFFLEKLIKKNSDTKFLFINTKLLVGNQLDIFKSDNVRIFE